jgi:hypothetical protein
VELNRRARRHSYLVIACIFSPRPSRIHLLFFWTYYFLSFRIAWDGRNTDSSARFHDHTSAAATNTTMHLHHPIRQQSRTAIYFITVFDGIARAVETRGRLHLDANSAYCIQTSPRGGTGVFQIKRNIKHNVFQERGTLDLPQRWQGGSMSRSAHESYRPPTTD